ncbi:unnamed protein product [Moneuplotes crassus]|uniref:Uncharacterized protein n=1 Tax=Euplotes crassus TaxID=5936 RepID=A0AAD1XJ92_EUPCR|nr:unnamed protein product [Moneuplotes crassus]
MVLTGSWKDQICNFTNWSVLGPLTIELELSSIIAPLLLVYCRGILWASLISEFWSWMLLCAQDS